MAEASGFEAAPRPDFYIAAMGRSGSTMLCNWLSDPPERIVFNEPFFLRPQNSRLLRIQLARFAMPVTDSEWAEADESASERFRRIMAHRLAGRHWAAKEVLCDEHFAMTKAFSPPRVLVSVRNMVDVALSLFEKHRLQDSLDRYSDQWVDDYCTRESDGLVDYVAHLEREGIDYLAVRYEDFTASESARGSVAEFVGWKGGGDVTANLVEFGRGFESERHGSGIGGGAAQAAGERSLPAHCLSAARAIAERCSRYQRHFGYI